MFEVTPASNHSTADSKFTPRGLMMVFTVGATSFRAVVIRVG